MNTPRKIIAGEYPEMVAGSIPIRAGVYTDHWERTMKQLER
jgi:hypothetical protein